MGILCIGGLLAIGYAIGYLMLMHKIKRSEKEFSDKLDAKMMTR